MFKNQEEWIEYIQEQTITSFNREGRLVQRFYALFPDDKGGFISETVAMIIDHSTTDADVVAGINEFIRDNNPVALAVTEESTIKKSTYDSTGRKTRELAKLPVVYIQIIKGPRRILYTSPISDVSGNQIIGSFVLTFEGDASDDNPLPLTGITMNDPSM